MLGPPRAALALGQLGRTDEAVTNGLLGLAGDPQVDAGSAATQRWRWGG
ncbi:MAG: hypothetical protein H6657_04100 [Ardenticatenaceae bacterium]|nr:hypothetical protein [Ardenticatenaceae bacterium]